MAKKIKFPQLFKRAVSSFATKPATTLYPYVEPKLPDNYRGKMVFDIQRCIGCGLCSRDCPSRAIEMVPTIDGKKRPQFRLDKCIFCYQCADTCPKKAITNSDYFEMATLDKSSLVMKPQPVVAPLEAH